MIYQKFKSVIINDEPLSSKLIDSEIDIFLEFNPNQFNVLVADLVSLYCINRENLDLNNILSSSFNYLFSKGLKWEVLQEMDLNLKDTQETINFNNLNLRYVKGLIKPAFNNFFADEFISNSKIFEKILFKSYSVGLFHDDTLLKVGNHLEIKNNKDTLNKIMLATYSFTEMKQLEKLFDINRWTVVTKENDIETLWPTHVWHMENSHLNVKIKTAHKEKQRIFWEDNQIFHQISTDKTSNIDFISRFVFATCNITNEKVYSEMLKLLNIDKINLDCIDYTSKSQKLTVREKMLKFGHLKIVNRFEKKDKNSKSVASLESIITSVPAQAHMISNKKAFLKQFINSLDQEINHTNLLEAVLKTKSRLYANSHYDVKCYLPLKKEYLNYSKEYWKNRKVDSLYFIDFSRELQIEAKLSSFVNLMDWITDKHIDWTKKTTTGNYLITDTIIAIMQFPTEYYLNDLSKHDNLLVKSYSLLPHSAKSEILIQIKNNWEKIWDFTNQSRHESEIIHSGFQKSSNTFTFMRNLMNDCLIDHVKISPELFDEKWHNIIEVFKKFKQYNEHADEFIRISEMLELESTLSISDHRTSIKKLKV